MGNETKIIEKFREIVGKDNVLSEGCDLLAYSTDASGIFGEARIVLFPKYNEDVRKIVRYALRTGLNVVPRGAGTGLVGGAVPDNSVVLDFSRMRRIMVLNRKEMTVVVEPGVVLTELNKELAKHGLFFPIVPSSQKVCTIGGMIATNAAGYRAIRYGKTADWIEQLEIVDGSGKLFTFNGKNDFIGSEGVLGIITKAKLKLTRAPVMSSMDFNGYESIHDLVTDVRNILQTPGVLGIEYFDRIVAGMLGLKDMNYLIVEYEDDQGEIQDPDEILRKIDLRENIAPIVASKGYQIYEDPKIELEKMDHFIEWLQKNNTPSFGHIGIGIIHPQFRKGQEKLVSRMFEEVMRLGGQVSGEHGIGLAKKKYADPSYKANIKRLKQKYDPSNVLNKGKIL